MNNEEFKARRLHLTNQNVMTANNPPADDVASLTDYYVEQITKELMEDLYNSPDRIQEYIMEGEYENTNLILIFQCLSDVLKIPNLVTINPLSIFALLEALKTYLDAQTTKKAEEYVESI